MMNDKEENNPIINRRDDLVDSLSVVLKSLPIMINKHNNYVSVSFQDQQLCGVYIEQEVYKIAEVNQEWAEKTNCYCEKDIDGTWYYYVETIDECIGEVNRLVVFSGRRLSSKDALYSEQYKTHNLEAASTWNGDMRPLMRQFFAPLFEGKAFYFEDSGEKTKNILNLFSKDGGSRIIGFQCLKSQSKRDEHKEINLFFDNDFYQNRFKGRIDLGPEKEKGGRKQPHFSTSLEKLWNVMCILTGNSNHMHQG